MRIRSLGLNDGRLAVAIRIAYRHAIDISNGFGGPDPELESNYANRLIELGRARDAIPLIEHALREAETRGLARIAPLLLVQGARAWCITGDLARCADLIAAARAGAKAVMPAGHSTHGTVELAGAQLALATADPSRARASLERSVVLFRAASDKNALVIRATALLARTEHQLGDLAGAQAHATQAVAMARDALAGFSCSEWLGGALVTQGLVQKARGETAAAQASWRDALANLQATVGADAPATLEVRRLLAAS